MRVRTLAAPTLAAVLALAASACFKYETPTGPSLAPSSNGIVHLVGLNTSSGSIGLNRYKSGEILSIVEVTPGTSVEMMQWNTLVTGARFIIFAPFPAPQSFRAVAEVEYNILAVPPKTDDVVAPVRVSLDASGAATVVSDRPDVVQILRVTPM
jgi:hypothetical protein